MSEPERTASDFPAPFWLARNLHICRILATQSKYQHVSLNHCNLSPWFLASMDYHAHPCRIELQGVRRENRCLFEKLDALHDANQRGGVFNDYMSVKFHLHEWQQYQASARKSLRNHYLKFIRNWGIDSNGCSGAVLKSWVESRMGIAPSFHRSPLLRQGDRAWSRYRSDVTHGSAQTSAIWLQLDLVYEYCQYELERRDASQRWMILYRGTHDPEEYELMHSGVDAGTWVRLNNLSSFTADRERAWEFGSTVWRVEIPVYKIFFFSGLLPDNLLRGEDEYMVIGGEYPVTPLLF